MKIFFHKEEISFDINNSDRLIDWIAETIKNYSFIPGEINFIFCGDDYLLNLNKEFLDHHYYTDIITFNYNIDQIINGDIFISIDRVKENAKEFSDSFNSELKRVIIHGILHLIGFGDYSETEKLKMRSLESDALKRVKDLIII